MEYSMRDGINYRADGHAFCDRCGSVNIVNRLCIHCDVKPIAQDIKTADEIRKHCYRPRQEPMRGFFDGRSEKFDDTLAARVLAAMRVPAVSHCSGCGACLDCIRRENYWTAQV
jgi:hypothetical protein